MSFCIYRIGKTWLDKCLKSQVSDDPSTSDMVNRPKHCLYLNESSFTTYIDPCERNSVEKSLS